MTGGRCRTSAGRESVASGVGEVMTGGRRRGVTVAGVGSGSGAGAVTTGAARRICGVLGGATGAEGVVTGAMRRIGRGLRDGAGIGVDAGAGASAELTRISSLAGDEVGAGAGTVRGRIIRRGGS